MPKGTFRTWNLGWVGLCRVVASFFSALGSGSPSPVEVAPAGLYLVVASFFSAPGSGSPSPVEVAPAGLCRVVASFFSAPGSGSPSPVEVAPAGLCRAVASFFSAPGSVSPSPVEVAPAGLCRVASSCLHGPRQWFPVPCGGCPRRPLSRRILSSRPHPRPCLGLLGGCSRPRRCLDSSSLAKGSFSALASIFRLGWLGFVWIFLLR